MKNVYLIVGLLITCFSLISTQAKSEVIITEIMYNPASKEKAPVQTEWLEIYNTGKKTVRLAGWQLKDEDGQTAKFPKDMKIKPMQAIVIIPGKQTIDDFRKAWGNKIALLSINKWSKGGIGGLANSPSKTNEILTLINSSGVIVDQVNYDDAKPWPRDTKEGPSIYLLPEKLNAKDNDKGKNWSRSVAGKNGAKHNRITADYNKQDTGSPGFVRDYANKHQPLKPKQQEKQLLKSKTEKPKNASPKKNKPKTNK